MGIGVISSICEVDGAATGSIIEGGGRTVADVVGAVAEDVGDVSFLFLFRSHHL